MIGGGGERRTLRTAALHAQEWNAWATPEVLERKNRILDRHSRETGRDPATIARSAAAFFELHEDPAAAAAARAERGDRSGLVGTAAEISAALDRYRSAGIDELVIPNYNYGPGAYQAALDRFQQLFAS